MESVDEVIRPRLESTFMTPVPLLRWHQAFFIAMGAVGTLVVDGSLDRWMGRGFSGFGILALLGGGAWWRSYLRRQAQVN